MILLNTSVRLLSIRKRGFSMYKESISFLAFELGFFIIPLALAALFGGM